MKPELHNKCLALQAIKLKALLNTALCEKGKSFFFRIDDALNSDFQMEEMLGWLPILPNWHYWIPTVEQIESIMKETGMECGYGSIPDSTLATYHHHVYTTDKEAEWYLQGMEGSGFFKHHAYMDLFLQAVTRNPKRIESVIDRIVEKRKESTR